MNFLNFFKKIFKIKNKDIKLIVNKTEEVYLYDFMSFASEYNNIVSSSNLFVTTGGMSDIDGISVSGSMQNSINFNVIDTKSKNSPKYVEIRPKNVLNELETIPNPISLTGIDAKISILKNKVDLTYQKHTKRELNSLIERLENRKKYTQYKNFFERFQNTTDENINKLLKKYDNLVMKTSEIFIPEFPDVAIEIMKKYTEVVGELCEKKPVFYVIATKDSFKTSDKKRDPILLVQSPFGFYWQILGAWDEEMILLSEL